MSSNVAVRNLGPGCGLDRGYGHIQYSVATAHSVFGEMGIDSVIHFHACLELFWTAQDGKMDTTGPSRTFLCGLPVTSSFAWVASEGAGRQVPTM